jgi:hypothetical protein
VKAALLALACALALAACAEPPAWARSCRPTLRPLFLDRQSCKDAVNPPPMCVAGLVAGFSCTLD